MARASRAADTPGFVDQLLQQIEKEQIEEEGNPKNRKLVKLVTDRELVIGLAKRVFGDALPNRPFPDGALTRETLGSTREILDGPFGKDYLAARARCEAYLGRTLEPIIEETNLRPGRDDVPDLFPR